MRVISGRAKGLRLKSPPSNRVRPALDKVKEAIFNILFDVSDARVLDLFAGTGSMGIEAISRGAKSAVFVESWNATADVIKKNLELCQFTSEGVILRFTVERAIKALSKKGETFDLIFVDPPYDKDLVNKTLEQLADSNIMHKDTLLVVEHNPREPIHDHPSLILTDNRKYGQTLVSFLQPRV